MTVPAPCPICTRTPSAHKGRRRRRSTTPLPAPGEVCRDHRWIVVQLAQVYEWNARMAGEVPQPGTPQVPYSPVNIGQRETPSGGSLGL